MSSHAAKNPLSHVVRGLALDVALPLATYYVVRALGFDDWVSLLGATIVAGLRTVYTAVRARTLNPFSAVMLLMFGVGLLLAFTTGSPQMVILKDSVGTAVIGSLFLITTVVGRPLTLEAYRSWSPDHSADIDRAWATDPRIRHLHRVISRVWGVGLLAEAIIRVPLVFLIPVDIMVTLSTVMQVAVTVALVAWSRSYADRVKQRDAATVAA